jgi:hypothetical protein
MVEQTLPLFYSENLEDSFLHSLLFEPQSAENLPPQLSLVSSAAFIMSKHGLMHESYRMIPVRYSLDIPACGHKNHQKHQNPFSMHNVYLVPRTYNCNKIIKLLHTALRHKIMVFNKIQPLFESIKYIT